VKTDRRPNKQTSRLHTAAAAAKLKKESVSSAATTVLTEYCNQLQQECNAENKLPDASYRKMAAAMLLPTENNCRNASYKDDCCNASYRYAYCNACLQQRWLLQCLLATVAMLPTDIRNAMPTTESDGCWNASYRE
jgi:hypothetical protein